MTCRVVNGDKSKINNRGDRNGHRITENKDITSFYAKLKLTLQCSISDKHHLLLTNISSVSGKFYIQGSSQISETGEGETNSRLAVAFKFNLGMFKI